MMNIDYRETKSFTPDELESLFRSVGWLSADYPDRLAAALGNSSTVISAWDGDKLAGLVNALDDGALTAYAHYLLVRPEYQGKGIGRALIERLREKYASYLYLLLISEEDKTVPFYEKLGFEAEREATPMVIKTL